MVTEDIPVNHDILAWARKEANLSPPNVAIKAGIKDLKARGKKEGLSSTLRLERWEKGIDTPTLPQLRKLAKAYRRPVLTFFLSKPLIKQTRIQDFRTVGDRVIDSESFSPEFSALLRRIEAMQLNLHDLLLKTDSNPVSFVASIKADLSPKDTAQKIRHLLDYSFDDQKNSGGYYEKVFSDIRTKAEFKGVFILLEGNLGSYHTNIPPDVFRGLAISDDIAPIIVINPNDAKPAMIFSLIHEFCHILGGVTGVSNWNSFNISEKYVAPHNEAFYSQVAAEFLVPESELLREWEKFTIGFSPEDSIKRIAKEFSVSRIVIARRLLDFGELTKDFYWEFFDSCREEWRLIKSRIKKKKEIQIPLKIRIRSRLGNRLTDTLISAAREGKISELDASRVLNVRINDLSKIV